MLKNQKVKNWTATLEPNTFQESPNKPKADSFWAERGYETPDSSTARSSSAMTDSSAPRSQSRQTSRRGAKSDRTEKGVETITAKDNKRFSSALLEHNINIKSEHDAYEHEATKILSKKLPKDVGFAVNETLATLQTRWQKDMSKCMSSNEALFQRTIMMEILERHELDEKLDYICETSWRTERRIPGRDISRKLSQPKPDLAVGFSTTSLLPEGATLASISRLGSLQSHVCAEGTGEGEVDRAFHFFSMEVKGKHGQLGNSEARLQNLNTAAQGLYNLYVVMKEAGMESEFYNKVRFFSVVATTSGFEVRVHRAVKLMSDDYIRPDCGIRFAFDEIHQTGSGYEKKTATTIVFNILLHYGVKTLHPLLQKAMKLVLKKHPGMAFLSRESPERSKRGRDDGLSESFESHPSQRRRMAELAVAG